MTHQGRPLEVTGGPAGAIGGALASLGVGTEDDMVAPVCEAGCGGGATCGPAGADVAAVADAGIHQPGGYAAPSALPGVITSSIASADHGPKSGA